MNSLYVIELDDGLFAEFKRIGERGIKIYAHKHPYSASYFSLRESAEEAIKDIKNKESDWSYRGDLNLEMVRKLEFALE